MTMHSKSPRELYLHLMKQSLSYLLWPEPDHPMMEFNYRRSPVKRFLIAAASRILALKNLSLVQRRTGIEQARRTGTIWPMYADTMIGLERLDNLQSCIETVIVDGVRGDLIETGVWRGGACIFMRAVLAAHGVTDRRVFVADSFKGLPKPDVEKWPADKGDRHYAEQYLSVSRQDVEKNFRRYELLDDQVVFLEGWFSETLPSAPIERLAVLRLDGDMYGSTMEALQHLYPKLQPGGFCIVDDYLLAGCRAAVDDFRKQHAITAEIQPIDGSGVFWRVSRGASVPSP